MLSVVILAEADGYYLSDNDENDGLRLIPQDENDEAVHFLTECDDLPENVLLAYAHFRRNAKGAK